MGAPEFVDVALRNAIDRGDIPGPVFKPRASISATGGHADMTGFSPYVYAPGFSGVADAVDEIRKKIRFLVKYGADVLKVTATAGAMSEEESVESALYTQEELACARGLPEGDEARGRAGVLDTDSSGGAST